MIGARRLYSYCHNTSLHCHKIQTKRFLRFCHISVMRTASDKKNQFVDLWAKKKIYLYFWQLRCSSQVTSYLDMLIESFGLMEDYPFFLLISKNISNLAVQGKTVVRVDERLLLFSFDFQENFKFGCSSQDCHRAKWSKCGFAGKPIKS